MYPANPWARAAIASLLSALFVAPMPLSARSALAVPPVGWAGLTPVDAAAPAAVEYTIGALRITAPWMRATPKGATVAGGYLTITNTGKEPDRLLRIESDVATTVEVHEMSMSGEVMRMRPLEKPLEIAPGSVVELKPSGDHLMFSRLRQSINQGDKVRARMVFEKAGEIEIEFSAEGIAATGPRNADKMPGQKM